ncbi:MAG TPA: hypothetical protein VFA94_03980 [Acidimicrobiales bacterium]|nr:hypothetical protein [Acidimicrobiales bacterium]
MTDHTKPTDATRQADQAAADADHKASEVLLPEEEAAADRNKLDPEVEQHYKEMVEKGAGQKGEGRI